MEGYIIGTLSTLLSVTVGWWLGKPYVDRWQQRRHAKLSPKPDPKPSTSTQVSMPGMKLPITGQVPTVTPTQP